MGYSRAGTWGTGAGTEPRTVLGQIAEPTIYPDPLGRPGIPDDTNPLMSLAPSAYQSPASWAHDQCPRCWHEGEGIPYFRRLNRAVALVGTSFVTLGLGGLAYWLARRRHAICEQCGFAWRPLAPGAPHPELARWAVAVDNPITRAQAAARGGPVEAQLPSSGIKRRVAGIAIFAVAGVHLLSSVFTGVLPIGTAVFWGGLGGLFYCFGNRSLKARRVAITDRLNRHVLQLAGERGGKLTVTEVAAGLNLSFKAAETTLVNMDDGLRVRSEVSDEGVIYYEFPEIIHAKELRPAPGLGTN